MCLKENEGQNFVVMNIVFETLQFFSLLQAMSNYKKYEQRYIYNDRFKKSKGIIGCMDKEIMKIAEQLKALSNVAVLQYTDIVNDILDEKITDEQEIACILDGMLDFCQFNEMLLLFKQVCRGLYLKHPGLVYNYILYYREMWDE